MALQSNVNDLSLAIEGRGELLQQIFGKKGEDADKPKPLTADKFLAMRDAHNAGIGAQNDA